MDTRHVTFGKPKLGGAIFSAPLGTALPTDAVGALDKAFKELGYASEDGLSNSNSPDADTIKAWGGQDVLTVSKGKPDEFTFTLIEALNVDTLKEVYGRSNVTGDLTTGITIKSNAKPSEPHSLVVDFVLNQVVKRVVIPNAVVKEIGDVEYKDDEAVGYETTISALPDGQGNTHYEYIKAVKE